MKNSIKTTISHALGGFCAGMALLAAIALVSGCGRHQSAVHVPHVPYKAHFDSARCSYLADGIRFRCKDVVFDPAEIDASGKK